MARTFNSSTRRKSRMLWVTMNSQRHAAKYQDPLENDIVN